MVFARIVPFMLDEELWSEGEPDLGRGSHGVVLALLGLFLVAMFVVGSRLV